MSIINFESLIIKIFVLVDDCYKAEGKSLKGLPVAYDLVSANTDERQAVEGVLDLVRNSDIHGDKGFICQDWQEEINHSTGNQIWTIHRDNQQSQHSPALKRLIGRVRQRIEGVFHEIQNTGS